MADTLPTKFIEVMFKTSRLFRERMHYSSQLAHLSFLQVQTLAYLKVRQNAQMSEIAENFHIELPSATSLLNKLVTLQLVKRQQDEKDRRLVRVVLTEQGNSILSQAKKEKEAHVKQMLSYLSDEEQHELLRLMEKLNERIDKDYEH
jgi:MarR family transcriptional regulator, organic hydroperoxide resistance regulator